MTRTRRHVDDYRTNLNGSINDSVTTINVADASALGTITSDEFIPLTIATNNNDTKETIHVTARSGNELTAVRGQDGTTAQSWDDLSLVECRLTSLGIDNKVDTESDQDIGGEKTFLENISIADGSVSSPSMRFSNSLTTGFYRLDSNVIGVTLNGTQRYRFDSSKLWITNLIDQSTSSNNGNALDGVKLQLAGSTVTTVAVKGSGSTTARFAPSLLLQRNSGSEASPTIVSSGNYFGRIDFTGYDGNDFQLGATISAEVDGTPAAGDMPGRIVWRTTTAGSVTPTEKMRLTNDGILRVNNGISFDEGTTVFDTVEENVSFTPVPFGSTTAGSPTGTFNGRYSRYGRRVFITIQIVFTDLGGLEGHFRVSGLPYNIAGGGVNRAALSIAFKNNFASEFVVGGFMSEADSTLRLYKIEEDNTVITHSDLTNTSELYITLSYIAAE
jgi:hypothetical protein